MNRLQHTNQESKKQFLLSYISRKSFRFTTALCAAAVLAGSVAYAATPETAAPAQQPVTAESTFTDIVMTNYDENAFLSPNLIRLEAPVNENVILVVVNNKINASLDSQNRIPCGWPVESRLVSTEFNPSGNASISDGRKHEGIDISTRSQIIPIYATATGTVVTAGYHPTYGNQVILDHGNGFTTLYAHCDEMMVSVGDTVHKGDVIATTGNTGMSTGVHLHYEIMLNGVYQNPRDYL